MMAYIRRWCNTASDSRPRPKMDPTEGVFGRVGTAITQDTGDYERLDRHYQELWKDRDPGRGGGRTGRGAGGRGGGGGRLRRVRGPGGRNANNLPAGFATIAAASARGGGRGDGAVGAARRDGGGGRGGGRGGGAGGSPSASRDAARAGTAAEAGRGAGGGERGVAGHRTRLQRANGAVKAGVGRPAGTGAGRVNGGPPHSSLSTNRVPQIPPSSAPGYPAQAGPAAVAAQPRAGGPGGAVPAQALNNVRGWSEGLDHQQHRELNAGGGGGGVGGGVGSSHPLGTWAMEPSSGMLPGTAAGAGAAVINGGGEGGGGAVGGTPPLVPAMPNQFAQSFPPESPEYLTDLANVLSSTPPPLYGGQQQQQQQQPQAVTPPLGPLLGGGDLFAGARGEGGGGGAGVFSPKQQGGGAALSPFLSPRQSTMLADPSLDVDIQDICADPDLNADAPAFVPSGY